MRTIREKLISLTISCITLISILSLPISLQTIAGESVSLELVDQECWDDFDVESGVLNYGSVIPNQYLAQSFQPTKTSISSIDLYLFLGIGGIPLTFNLTIHDSTDKGYANLSYFLAESQITLVADGSYGWYNFNFPDFAVTPNTTYFIKLDANGGTLKNVYENHADIYLTGSGWRFLIATDTGYTESNFDFMFRSYYNSIEHILVADAGKDYITYVDSTVIFNGSASYDMDGELVNYTWDLGDGTYAYGVSIHHTYHSPGLYTVTLTVFDNIGWNDIDTCEIIVVEYPNEPPVADIEISGYYGKYYNLPEDHPDVEGPITGLVIGDSPYNHDWYDECYHSFDRIDNSLDFGNNFWPLDEGLPGDPLHFAVSWEADFQINESGTFTFELGSDDDSWVFIDDEMVVDLGGIHALIIESHDIFLDAGLHTIKLFFAERHEVQSGFYFKWVSPGMDVFIPSDINEFNVDVNQTICLTAYDSYDSDGTIVNYSWFINDIDVSYGPVWNFSKYESGIYHIKLMVYDNNGSSSSMELFVNIIAFNEPSYYEDTIPYQELESDELGVVVLVQIENSTPDNISSSETLDLEKQEFMFSVSVSTFVNLILSFIGIFVVGMIIFKRR